MGKQHKITSGEWFDIFAQGYSSGDDGNSGGTIEIQTEETDSKAVESVSATAADIQLMKSAPKLLDALKLARDSMKHWQEDRNFKGDVDPYRVVIARINAAIKRAELGTIDTEDGHRTPPLKKYRPVKK